MHTQPVDQEPLELLRAEQVGEILGRHPRTVLALHKAGKLPAIKLGPRGIRFLRSDVQRFIEAHRVDA
jgi:excisionase family DNA binding protein